MNGDLFSRIAPTKLAAHVGALIFAAFIAGCPTAATDTPTDGDAGPDTDAAIDTGPPCSRMTTLCGPNKACKGPPDCASGLCRDNVCHDVAPADGRVPSLEEALKILSEKVVRGR